jgi:hypothetical protein
MEVNQMKNRIFGTLLLCTLTLFSGIAQAGKWTSTGSMSPGVCGFMGALLTDGRYMILNGGNSSGAVKNCDIFDPATGVWTNKTSPAGSYHTVAILLPDGNVFLVGQSGQTWSYSPFTKNWVAKSSLGAWSERGCATLLDNGKVLFTSYYSSSHKRSTLYEHSTNTMTVSGSCSHDHFCGSVETLLPSGELLICGGNDATGTKKTEIYDPGSETWTTVGDMNVARSTGVGVLLPMPWNKVLMAGDYQSSSSTELYDIITRTWSPTGSLSNSSRDMPSMCLLPSGKVLIMGGGYATAGAGTNVCEIYDPDTRLWTLTDPMISRRSHHNAVVLQTGKVLTVAGYGTGFVSAAEIYDPSDGKCAAKLNLNTERAAQTVTVLPIIHTTNCSTNVLIAGGENSSGSLKSCELYNYGEEKITYTSDLNDARACHTAVLLTSGQVLAAGGKNLGSALRSSELYNAATEAWTPTGNMGTARYNHTATVQRNGDVLVTGGETVAAEMSSCEIYTSGTWMPVGAMTTARTRHSAILLLDGRIMVIGGKSTGAATNTCEIWNGAAWAGAASLATARYWHTAVLLQSGKVLVMGGTSDGTNPIATCEIYNPSNNTWAAGASLHAARYQHNSTLLYSGLVLTTGGYNGSAYLSSFEVFDPAIQKWKADVTAVLNPARAYHSSVLVPDEKPYVLVIGGTNGTYLNSIQEYDVGLEYRDLWQSTITSHPSVTQISDPMPITGTLFRGVSEADAGSHCHIVSNDHPIISLVRVGGGNWQGNGGGDIMYMPLSSSWNDVHTDIHPPDSLPDGYYRLWSIVNGIPCRWYKGCVGVEDSQQSTVHSPQFSVFPNPFTHNTVVEFGVRGSEFVDGEPSTLKIYDLGGRLVRTFNLCNLDKSVKSVTWDGTDESGQRVRSGIYLCKLKTGNEFLHSQKVLFLK